MTGMEDTRALAEQLVGIGMDLLGVHAASASLRIAVPEAGIGLIVDALQPRLGLLDDLVVTDEDPLLCAELAKKRRVTETLHGRFRELWPTDGVLFDVVLMAPRQTLRPLDRPEFHVKHALNRWLAPAGVLVAVVPKRTDVPLGQDWRRDRVRELPISKLHSHVIVTIEKGKTDAR